MHDCCRDGHVISNPWLSWICRQVFTILWSQTSLCHLTALWDCRQVMHVTIIIYSVPWTDSLIHVHVQSTFALQTPQKKRPLPRMLLSCATCTYSAQFVNVQHNNWMDKLSKSQSNADYSRKRIGSCNQMVWCVKCQSQL